MLSVTIKPFIIGDVMLTVVMLTVIMLTVVMLGVVAPPCVKKDRKIIVRRLVNSSPRAGKATRCLMAYRKTSLAFFDKRPLVQFFSRL